MVRIKDTESDGLTHKETLSGITKKIRIHKHTRRAPTSTDAGAGAGDGRGAGGLTATLQSRSWGMVKRIFPHSGTLTISRKPSRRQEKPGRAERALDSEF